MHRWRRPYPLGFLIWTSIIAIPFVVIIATLAAADIVTGEPVWMFAVVGPIWLGGVGLAVRSAMVGVYVSEDGVLSRTLFGARQVEWQSVVGFRDAEATFGGIGRGRQALYLDVAGGESVQTPIAVRGHFDGFNRKATSGKALYWPDQFDEILAILRAELATRRPATPAPRPDAVSRD